MIKHIVVAIDGPAGSGKSSVSKSVAIKQGLKYIDSGALYRAVTWYMLEKCEKIEENIDYSKYLTGISLSQEFHADGTASTYVNKEDVSEKIRNERIAKNIGIISDNKGIRNYINEILRSWSKEESILMDGRDIGTIVFPDADLKIYLDASVDERADRRYKEYQEKGKNVDLNDIKNQIILRDNQDKSREFGALKQAKDAIYIETSSMTKDEVIDKFVEIIDSKLRV